MFSLIVLWLAIFVRNMISSSPGVTTYRRMNMISAAVALICTLTLSSCDGANFEYVFPSTNNVSPKDIGWVVVDEAGVESDWKTYDSSMKQTADLSPAPHEGGTVIYAKQAGNDQVQKLAKDFKLTVAFAVSGEEGNAGIVFRYHDQSSYLRVFASRKIARCILDGVDGSDHYNIATSMKTICNLELNVKYEFIVETNGPRIKVFMKHKETSTIIRIFDVLNVGKNDQGGLLGLYSSTKAYPSFESVRVEDTALAVLQTPSVESDLLTVGGLGMEYRLNIEGCHYFENADGAVGYEPRGDLLVYLSSTDASIISVDPQVLVTCGQNTTVRVLPLAIGGANIVHALSPHGGGDKSTAFVAPAVELSLRVQNTAATKVSALSFDGKTRTGGHVKITWSAPNQLTNGGSSAGHIVGYQILRQQAGKMSTIGGVGYTELFFHDNDVLSDTEYTYTVICLTDTGRSVPSDPLTVKTSPMSSPTSPKVAVIHNFGGAATIAWDAPDDTGGFPLMPMTDQKSTFTITVENRLNASEKFIVDTTPSATSALLEHGYPYSSKVVGLDSFANYTIKASAESSASFCIPEAAPGEFLFTATMPKPATAATLATISSNEITGSAMALEWYPPEDTGGTPISGYKVYMAEASPGISSMECGSDGDWITVTGALLKQHNLVRFTKLTPASDNSELGWDNNDRIVLGNKHNHGGRSTVRAEAVLPFKFTEIKGTWSVHECDGSDEPLDNGGYQCSWGTSCAYEGQCGGNSGWLLFGTPSKLIKHNENSLSKMKTYNGAIENGAIWPSSGAPVVYSVAETNILRWQSSQYGNNRKMKISDINLHLKCTVTTQYPSVDLTSGIQAKCSSDPNDCSKLTDADRSTLWTPTLAGARPWVSLDLKSHDAFADTWSYSGIMWTSQLHANLMPLLQMMGFNGNRFNSRCMIR